MKLKRKVISRKYVPRWSCCTRARPESMCTKPMAASTSTVGQPGVLARTSRAELMAVGLLLAGVRAAGVPQNLGQ